MAEINDPSGTDERLEPSIQLDFRQDMSYGDYLNLTQLLSAQHPRSQPAAYDELLFIIQHQTSELWLKLALHELRGARSAIAADELGVGLKRLARIKQILNAMTEQWSVLATITPSEYATFRRFLATSSGFQSAQYRAVEFILGNKNRALLSVFESEPETHAMLTELLESPSLYDEFLRYLHRLGFPIPAEVLQRDVSQRYRISTALVEVLTPIYRDETDHWRVYETCEELVDLEDAFQLWRFRHLRTVQRIIGTKTGTGGSSGVGFLRKALETEFFPELYALRSEIDD